MAPIIISLVILVTKLSSKGFGFTKGTIDKKLQSIDCQTELSQKQMIKLLNENNLFVASIVLLINLCNLCDLIGIIGNYDLIASVF